jgi:hypothetical protein
MAARSPSSTTSDSLEEGIWRYYRLREKHLYSYFYTIDGVTLPYPRPVFPTLRDAMMDAGAFYARRAIGMRIRYWANCDEFVTWNGLVTEADVFCLN